jgi:hypothetical protein
MLPPLLPAELPLKVLLLISIPPPPLPPVLKIPPPTRAELPLIVQLLIVSQPPFSLYP